jgi:hypothetical protein
VGEPILSRPVWGGATLCCSPPALLEHPTHKAAPHPCLAAPGRTWSRVAVRDTADSLPVASLRLAATAASAAAAAATRPCAAAAASSAAKGDQKALRIVLV